MNGNVSLATYSPALEYATNNIGRCKVVISVYTNDGVLIGTEFVNDPALIGISSVKQRCERYNAHLDRSRNCMRRLRAPCQGDVAIIPQDPYGRCS